MHIIREGDQKVGKVFVFDHPLIQHKLTLIRDKNTGTKEFRELVEEIATLMVYEMTRELSVDEIDIETPISSTKGKVISGKAIGFVPLLRAGLGMLNGLIKLIPTAKIGHIGLYRDENTHKPIHYYAKMPLDIDQREVIVIDPMLATGGSACTSIQLLKDLDVRSIRLMCLIAAPEGIERLKKEHPEVDVYTASIDERLDENQFIVPGLGDAGDRLFGTD